MDPKHEILGADYTEHNIKQSPGAVEIITTSSSKVSNPESQISQRIHSQKSDDKMAGVYKTYFTDELATDRSKTPARDNPAFHHDEGV